MYVSFILEFVYTVSQLKYGLKKNSTKDIFDTLRENLTFLKMNKFQSQMEASIGFFGELIPNLLSENHLNRKSMLFASG